MKLSKTRLKKIIKEEVERLLSEAEGMKGRIPPRLPSAYDEYMHPDYPGVTFTRASYNAPGGETLYLGVYADGTLATSFMERIHDEEIAGRMPVK